jgi:hypothetical protein
MTFKQNDLKAMRSKSLLTEIENIYDEVSAFPDHVCFSTADKYSFLIHQKQEQAVEGNGDLTGPHMIFTYKVFDYILPRRAFTLLNHLPEWYNKIRRFEERPFVGN